MSSIKNAYAAEPPEITAPLSLRLGEARAQLGAMFEAGEFAAAGDYLRKQLRDLELFLLEASLEALALEGDAALALARCKPRRSGWRRFLEGGMR